MAKSGPYAKLIQSALGISDEEIGASYHHPQKAEDVHEAICRQAAELSHNIVDGIAKRAQDGDIAAAEWLESRGVIRLPKKTEC